MHQDIIMGWDAAWTPNGSGAWAICRGRELLLLETCATGNRLLQDLARHVHKFQPVLIAMDFPIAVDGVRGWRQADLETTRAFSRYGCPVHSPNPERPGKWGDQIVALLKNHGYQVKGERSLGTKALVEVYPHTANIHLHRSRYRIPYKVGRAAKYWPELSLTERKEKLCAIYQEHWQHLGEHIDLPTFPAPNPNGPLSALKTLEDQIDALLCIYAGKGIQKGDFQPYGTPQASIWNPIHTEFEK
ncbi:MAG: DUF429 domain-containing protein [Verrucomicrobia bacterium]|nr:DUF429 domain-containing protein [Verrucomicrobiota bacterium]MCH8514042.1 DUF429 domain-containing protein [Kiritimatiellia bacterium]